MPAGKIDQIGAAGAPVELTFLDLFGAFPLPTHVTASAAAALDELDRVERGHA